MRTRFAVSALLLGICAAPTCAMAQTVGVAPPQVVIEAPMLGVDNARNVAVMNGMVDIRKIEFYDDNWHVDGRDAGGHHVWMTIDPRTGTVAHLERYD